MQLAHHCATGSDRVPSTRVRHELSYITQIAGYAVLSSKDTFHSNIKVKSIYLHDNRNGVHQAVRGGQSGLVLQAFMSRASFRRILRNILRNGKSHFTMTSLHINNHFAEKRSIGKNLLLTVRSVMSQEQVDMVAGDFNGAACRQSGSDHRHISTIAEAFANTYLPFPPGAPPLEMCQANGLTCAVLRKPLGSENEWQIRIHGAFKIPHDTLGITRRNQSCHTKFGFTSSTLKPAGFSPIPG